MANRHLSRSIAMQSLYEWDFKGKDSDKLDEIVKRNIKEFGPGIEEADFIWQIINGVIENLSKLNKREKKKKEKEMAHQEKEHGAEKSMDMEALSKK